MNETRHPPGRPRLSVAMIVRDAADVLANSLDSVRGIADELVVIDLGSSDDTMAVARQGADVVDHVEWQENFAEARNECLGRVTGEWVLWLEAGETLDDTSAQQLRNFVNEAADPNKAYLLFVQRPAASAANCADQIGQLRLVPNRPELRFRGRVREDLFRAVKDAGMGVDALECIIERRATDAQEQRARARLQLNLANLSLTESGDVASPLLARAEALAQLGRPQEAGHVYRRAIELAERGSSELLEAYYGLLNAMDADPVAAERQIATCIEALEIYPLDAQLLCGMGSYLLRRGRLDLAARSYEMAVKHGQVDPATWHLADLADMAVICWSLVLQLMKESEQAESVLQSALSERPESLRLRRQLIELYVKAGRERDALAQCASLPEDMPFREQIPIVVRGALLAAAKKSAAALRPLRAAYQAGCRDPLCFRWLAAAQLDLGNLADVEIIVDEWERAEPGNLEIAVFRKAAADRRHGQSTLRVDGPASLRIPSLTDAPSFPSMLPQT
ncbi:MAG TPA: glycosyltransferase [Lacipirellulaceae bacterium]|nr:glycosyltransferase [Lacipirellulaceae bacterium]